MNPAEAVLILKEVLVANGFTPEVTKAVQVLIHQVENTDAVPHEGHSEGE